MQDLLRFSCIFGKNIVTLQPENEFTYFIPSFLI